VSKHGINLADNAQNGIVVFDNVVYNVQYAGIRFNTTLLTARRSTQTPSTPPTSAAYRLRPAHQHWNLAVGAVSLENNIFWPPTTWLHRRQRRTDRAHRHRQQQHLLRRFRVHPRGSLITADPSFVTPR